MLALSGQTKTPTFEYGDFMVADFDMDSFDELNEFPEIRQKLEFSKLRVDIGVRLSLVGATC